MLYMGKLLPDKRDLRGLKLHESLPYTRPFAVEIINILFMILANPSMPIQCLYTQRPMNIRDRNRSRSVPVKEAPLP